MGLSRLAALHGVATSYSPSPDVTVSVPDDTVIAVLAALGVDSRHSGGRTEVPRRRGVPLAPAAADRGGLGR